MLVFVLSKSNAPIASPSLSTCEFDNATLNRLFPATLKDELNIIQIEFNPIAPSILTKALTRIVNLASTEVCGLLTDIGVDCEYSCFCSSMYTY